MNRKRKSCILVYLVVMVMSMETAEAIRLSTLTAIQRIKSSTARSGKDTSTRLDKIKNLLEKGDAHSEVVSSAIDSIGGSIGSIMSGDVLDMVTGVLGIVSTMASLIPVGGAIVSTVFSLISTIIGLVGGGGDDMGSIVKKVIDSALANYDDSNLRALAEGASRIYRNSQAYLRATEGLDLKTHELPGLIYNVNINHGISFLGQLKSKIQDNVVSQDLVQVRRAMEYTQLYVILATLRSAVLWQLYATIRKAEHSTHSAIGTKAIAESEEATDKAFIRYLETPEYNQAIFFACLYMSKWPIVTKYMQVNGMKYQDLGYLASSKHTLKPQEWTNWYMIMTDSSAASINGRTHPGNEGTFYFDKLGDNFFHLRPQRWTNWYVYMTWRSNGSLAGWGSKPGEAGEWKVVKFSDGKYMLSPRKWLNFFIYMSKSSLGSVLGNEGDPGIRGHWIIENA